VLWPLDCFAALAMTVELTHQLSGIALESRCVWRRRNSLILPVYWHAKRLFRLRTDYVEAPRKLLKSLGREMSEFAVSMRFQGFMTHFIRAFFRHPFSDPPVGPGLNLVSQNSPIARIRFQGKPKGESPEFAHLFGSTESIVWSMLFASALASAGQPAPRRHAASAPWRPHG
jgi:hypothetical protein